MSKSKSIVPRNEKGHFLKGQSGNPTGRPLRMLPDGKGGFISRTELFQRDVVEVVETLMTIVRDPKSKDRDKIVAGKILIEHAFGAPKQHVDLTDHTTDNVRTIVADDIPLDELRKLVNAKVIELDAEIVDDDGDE